MELTENVLGKSALKGHERSLLLSQCRAGIVRAVSRKGPRRKRIQLQPPAFSRMRAGSQRNSSVTAKRADCAGKTYPRHGLA